MATKSGRMQLPFTNGFYKSRSKPLSSQQCVNWHPQDHTIPSLSQSSLFTTPGIVEMVSGLDGQGRGLHVWNNVLYAVYGNSLYRISRTILPDGESTFSSTYIGPISGDIDVIMVSLKNQMCILVPDTGATTTGNAYIYDGSSLTDITSESNFLSPAISVVAIDSYFVFAQYNTRFIFHSNLNDGTTFNAVDAWEVQQYPSNKGLVVYQNNLYASGESVTVPFYNADELEFSFRPNPGAVYDFGLAGQYAVSLFRGSFVFVGSGENAERSVWLFNGGQPEKISDEPLDFIIQNQTPEDLQSCRLQRHSQNGAEFICLYIADYCFVYDLVSGRWHERRSKINIGSSLIDSQWRAQHIAQAYNKVFVSDSNTGLLGELVDEIGTEYGTPMHRFFITQPFLELGRRLRVYAIEVYMDVGKGDDNMQLSWSDDGGFTWSETLSRGMGAAGEYGRRVVFNRLGAVPNTRMLRFDYYGEQAPNINAIMANVL